MKKSKVNFRKTALASMLFVLMTLVATAFVACSSDDDDAQPSGGMDIATGTFKGKITVYPPQSQSIEYFDAEVTVAKVSDKQLKVTPKSGQPYSIATAKTFQVEYSSAGTDLQTVTAVAGSPEGLFLYNQQNKSLNLITEEQSASEVAFAFEGTKQ